MLNKIIHFSLQNRILVLVASVLLLIGGTYTAFHTEVDVFPDLNAPTVVIMTEANGMAAEEVEQLVTFPVETAVNGATHVRRVRSSSTNGFSVVWVEFEWDTDIYLARQIVSEKLSLVSEELPENVGKPTMGPQSSILGELLIIGLTSDTTSMLDLRTLADWTIRPRLLSTGGVAQVAVLGGDIKEYQVLLDPARMKHYNVTLAEVMNVTRNMNQNANGGVIYEYGNEYIVRGVLSSHDVAQLSRSVIKTVEGVPVTLEDIADVKIGSQEPKLGTASERGKPAVLLTVTKQPKTGTIELTEQFNIKNIPTEKLMDIVSFVFQDSFLFFDTLYENIRVGNSSAGREEVIAAAKAAQCHEFIESLPQGYETRIGDEGVYLSGGESQRVCVARAILKNAPILVLDEATAFADPENEYKMQQALQHLIQNKTVIIIAHRLSSIISAQQIIVLNEGKLVQHGKHEILSKTEGLYKNMWDAYTDAFRWELNSKKEVKE